MSLAANCGLYPWGVSRTPNLPMNCHSNFSKQISHFHRPFAASKANCGWYLDAAVSALRTLDRKIFRSNCNFSNEQAESTYFRQFAKMDSIFFILNWICDGILAVLTKGLALQYGARSRVLSTKTKIYKNFAAKKKPFAVYICMSVRFGGAPHKKYQDGYLDFCSPKKRQSRLVSWRPAARTHGRTDGRTHKI